LEELRRAGAGQSLLQALQQFAAGDEPRLGTSPPPATPTAAAPPAESSQPASPPTSAAPTTGDVQGPSINAASAAQRLSRRAPSPGATQPVGADQAAVGQGAHHGEPIRVPRRPGAPGQGHGD
jgi:outer membrane biosynthesis protein TonB